MKKVSLFGLCLLCLSLVISLSCQVSSFDIVKDGKANATVIIGSDATEEDHYAANEFIKYVNEISGVVLTESTTPDPKGFNVYIGESKVTKSFIKKMKPTFKWESLKTDGILIYKQGNNLVLAGDNSGTIYAVYTFLEDNCGIRFLTPEDEYIPKSDTITVVDAEKYSKFFTYTPKIMSRESFFTVNNGNWPYDLKLKLNGHNNPVPNAYGGHVVLNGFAHTFNTLINPEVYGKDHPEWFSERNGERMATRHGQLCLSNQEMVAELIKNVLKTIEANPEDKIFSCTQNDTQNYCTCPECVKLTEKYGHSGALLTVINQIADAIKDKYPDKYIETFAYQYTREAPKGGIVPRDNVIIRLCSIECDFGHDFKHPNNKAFWKDLQDWKEICKTLYMWDYVSDFSDYIIPHPNVQVLQPNVQYMAENNVIAIFEEGDYSNTNSMLNHYKRYILAKLMWDPYMDMEKETKIFFDLFYGDAGEDMLKFNEALKQPFLRDDNIKLLTFMHDCNYYTAEDWVEIFTHLNNALSKTEEGSKYYDRVYTDMICTYAGFSNAYNSVKAEVSSKIQLPFKSTEEFMKNITEKAPSLGIKSAGEGRPLKDSIYAVQAYPKEGTKPKLCENLSDEEWIDIQESQLTEIFPGYGWSEIRDDPKASNGKAMWMNPIPPDWYVQKVLTSIYQDDSLKTGDVYVSYRVVPGEAEGVAFNGGIYNEEAKDIATTTFGSGDTKDGEYTTKYMGTIDFKNTTNKTFLWFCGNQHKEFADCMYIDRAFIILHK